MLRDTKSAEQGHKTRHRALSEAYCRSQRILLYFSLFCWLTLLLPDSSLIVSDKSIYLPVLNVPISLYHFIPIASLVLIALSIYLHALQAERLTAARTTGVDDVAPILFNLPRPLARILAGVTSYCLVPLTLVAMTYKALVHPELGGIMVIVTMFVTVTLICLLHLRCLLAIDPLAHRIKCWVHTLPHVATTCLIFLSPNVIAAGKTDAEIKESVVSVYMAFLKERMVRPLDLAYADLSGATLRNAYLKEAKLQYANLRGAHLPRADLRRANLSRANLQGADLHKAKLQDASLYRADLEGADLHHAQLQGVDLRGAKLENADLHEAILTDAKLNSAVLTGADLHDAQLQNVKLREAKLENADLHEAVLTDAKLNSAVLTGADLRRADLSRADLSEASLEGADVSGLKLEDLRLRQTKLPCCIYVLTAREGDFGSISTGSPVYGHEREVGYILSSEDYHDDSRNGRRITIVLKSKAPKEPRFFIILAKNAKVPEDGIALEQPLSSDGFAREDHPFSLYRNRVDGMGSIDQYKIHYDHSVHGLEVGAPVKLSGIEVGDVHGIDLTRKENGKLQVTITIRLMQNLGRGNAIPSSDIVCSRLWAYLKPISTMDPRLFIDLDPAHVAGSATAEVERRAYCPSTSVGTVSIGKQPINDCRAGPAASSACATSVAGL